MPGARSLFGNVTQLLEYEKISTESETNMTGPFRYLGSLYAKSKGMTHYDAGKTPILLINTLNSIALLVGDPDIVKEFYTSKNTLIDKHSDTGKVYKPLLGNGIVLSLREED